MPNADHETTMMAVQQREQDLFERYRRRFKEYPPLFGVSDSQRAAFLRQVEQAIRTGKPIELNIPPGCEA